MIRQCAKLDQVEKAFALHEKLTAQGMTANPTLSSVLIYAASKRKEYFPKAIDIFRQMELLKMPIDIFVYNNLLSACAKAADLNTAMALWQSILTTPSLRPNVFTCTNYIWALASVETRSSKISKRDFVYEGTSLDLIQAVDEVRKYMQTSAIPLNSHSLSAMLAVYSNHGAQFKAEELFWKKYNELNLPRDPFSYELIFKLYDNVRNYEGAEKVYRDLKDRNIKIPYEGWRALARTAALYVAIEFYIIL
jgi:pentatricopeptide repeat protein